MNSFNFDSESLPHANLPLVENFNDITLADQDPFNYLHRAPLNIGALGLLEHNPSSGIDTDLLN